MLSNKSINDWIVDGENCRDRLTAHRAGCVASDKKNGTIRAGDRVATGLKDSGTWGVHAHQTLAHHGGLQRFHILL